MFTTWSIHPIGNVSLMVTAFKCHGNKAHISNQWSNILQCAHYTLFFYSDLFQDLSQLQETWLTEGEICLQAFLLICALLWWFLHYWQSWSLVTCLPGKIGEHRNQNIQQIHYIIFYFIQLLKYYMQILFVITMNAHCFCFFWVSPTALQQNLSNALLFKCFHRSLV